MNSKSVQNAHGIHVNIHTGDKVVYNHFGSLQRGFVSSFGNKNGETILNLDNDSNWVYGSQIETVITSSR